MNVTNSNENNMEADKANSESPVLRINVKTIDNFQYCFDICAAMTIKELKTLIRMESEKSVEPMENTDTDADTSSILPTNVILEANQRLIYRGRVLQDDTTVLENKLEDGHTIHLVTKKISPSQTDNGSTSGDISSNSNFSNIARAVSETPPEIAENVMENIRQSLLTLRTIYSSVDADATSNAGTSPNLNSNSVGSTTPGGHHNPMNTPDTSDRNRNLADVFTTPPNAVILNSQPVFHVGQWLDVKDSVSQWLEATIMDINTDTRMMYVHYNGWPVRWDEWISWDSPRVAPFRTRTMHTSNTSNTLSNHDFLQACPTVVTRIATPGSDGASTDPVQMLSDIIDMSGLIMNYAKRQMDRYKPHTENPNGRHNRSSSECYDDDDDLLKDIKYHSPTHSPVTAPCTIASPGENTEFNSNSNGGGTDNRNSGMSLPPRVYSEIAPLFDRLGRVLIDMAPQLQTLGGVAAITPPSDTIYNNSLGLPSSIAALLRPRVPSPSRDLTYRQVISTSNRQHYNVPNSTGSGNSDGSASNGTGQSGATGSTSRGNATPNALPRASMFANTRNVGANGILGGLGRDSNVDVRIHTLVRPVPRPTSTGASGDDTESGQSLDDQITLLLNSIRNIAGREGDGDRSTRSESDIAADPAVDSNAPDAREHGNSDHSEPTDHSTSSSSPNADSVDTTELEERFEALSDIMDSVTASAATMENIISSACNEGDDLLNRNHSVDAESIANNLALAIEEAIDLQGVTTMTPDPGACNNCDLDEVPVVAANSSTDLDTDSQPNTTPDVNNATSPSGAESNTSPSTDECPSLTHYSSRNGTNVHSSAHNFAGGDLGDILGAITSGLVSGFAQGDAGVSSEQGANNASAAIRSVFNALSGQNSNTGHSFVFSNVHRASSYADSEEEDGPVPGSMGEMD